MATLNIHTYPDPVLKQTSAPVEAIDKEVRRFLDDMAETMYTNNGIGLAAPQVGRALRLIVVDVARGEAEGQLLKLINPRVVKGRGKTRSEEGCLSLPDLLVEIERHEGVTVEATLPDGKPTKIDATGLLSICLQHEIDHLDGRLLVDYLSSLRRSLYLKKRLKEASKDPGRSAPFQPSNIRPVRPSGPSSD